MDDRKLTLIVVPHGDLETKTFEIAYWKLKVGLFAGILLLLGFGFVVATWFPIAAQASRVPGLVRDLESLEAERHQVAQLAETLAEVEAQYERVRQLLGADAAGRDGEPILPPLPNRDTAASRVEAAREEGTPPGATPDAWPLPTAGFVTRTMTDGVGGHPGLDVAVPRDTEIRAAGAGVVRLAGFDEVYGEFALIDHGGGLASLYGHASRILVSAGERVARSQRIGYTGSSGRSSGPHLHFEIRRDGIAIDPLLFVKQP